MPTKIDQVGPAANTGSPLVGPNYPSTVLAGDYLVLAVNYEGAASNNDSISSSGDWTKVLALAGGSIFKSLYLFNGNPAGKTGSVGTITATGATYLLATVLRLRVTTAGNVMLTPWLDYGVDSSSGTAYSAASQAAVKTQSGGLLVYDVAFNNTTTRSGRGIAQTGATFGANSAYFGTGTGMTEEMGHYPITIGAEATLTQTFSTLGTASTGITAFLALAEGSTSTLAGTTAAATATMDGTVSSGTATGTIATQTAPPTVSFVEASKLTADAVAAISSPSFQAALASRVDASLNVAVPTVLGSVSGASYARSSIASAIASPSAQVTGSMTATGSLSSPVQGPVVTTVAVATSEATLTAGPAAATASMAGRAVDQLTLTATAPAVGMVGTGRTVDYAAVIGATGPASMAMAGQAVGRGNLAAATSAVVSSLSGQSSTPGGLTLTSPSAVAGLTGDSTSVGEIVASGPVALFAGDGEVEVPDTPTGAMLLTVAPPTAQMSGRLRAEGGLTSSVGSPSVAIGGEAKATGGLTVTPATPSADLLAEAVNRAEVTLTVSPPQAALLGHIGPTMGPSGTLTLGVTAPSAVFASNVASATQGELSLTTPAATGGFGGELRSSAGLQATLTVEAELVGDVETPATQGQLTLTVLGIGVEMESSPPAPWLVCWVEEDNFETSVVDHLSCLIEDEAIGAQTVLDLHTFIEPDRLEVALT